MATRKATTAKTSKAARPKRVAAIKTSSRRTNQPLSIILNFGTERLPVFISSKAEALRHLRLSQSELIVRAAKAAGMDPTQIALEGALERAQKIVATLNSSSREGGRGIIGSADKRLQAAHDRLSAESDLEITAARLAYACEPRTGYQTALNWLNKRRRSAVDAERSH